MFDSMEDWLHKLAVRTASAIRGDDVPSFSDDQWQEVVSRFGAKVKPELLEMLRLYLTKRINSNGFVSSVLTNNWAFAIHNAPKGLTQEDLLNFQKFVEVVVPANAYGTEINVYNWTHPGVIARYLELNKTINPTLLEHAIRLGLVEPPKKRIPNDKLIHLLMEHEFGPNWGAEM